jgi:diadenosine tetraphosphate (Ap4A) HIT family hydrolase
MRQGCYSCASNARLDDLPVRERVFRDDQWRVAHSFNSALPGWLVVVPTRHVESPHELTSEEGLSLGPLLRDLSLALVDVVGCLKTYIVMFAEAEGFQHVHFHVIPRMPDAPADKRGPNVFGYLKEPEKMWVPTDEMDRIAESVQRQMQDR